MHLFAFFRSSPFIFQADAITALPVAEKSVELVSTKVIIRLHMLTFILFEQTKLMIY